MTPEIEESIENAKINYNSVLSISNRLFTQKASEILGISVDRLEIRKSTENRGFEGNKLNVYIYREGDNLKHYYQVNNGSVSYRNLSLNIFEFETELKSRLK